jgi:hypothetical protein
MIYWVIRHRHPKQEKRANMSSLASFYQVFTFIDIEKMGIIFVGGENLKRKNIYLFFGVIVVITVIFAACVNSSMKTDNFIDTHNTNQPEYSELSSKQQSSSSNSIAVSSSEPASSPSSSVSQSATLPDSAPSSQSTTAQRTGNSKRTWKRPKVAYLTFDDGPSKLTPMILDILKAKNVKATFFVIGKDDFQSNQLLIRMVREGHSIGVHSWSHKYQVIYQSEQSFMDDFNRLKDHIYQVTGVQPRICRFPGGLNNTVCLKGLLKNTE